jgi:hypothetical protein
MVGDRPIIGQNRLLVLHFRHLIEIHPSHDDRSLGRPLDPVKEAGTR